MAQEAIDQQLSKMENQVKVTRNYIKRLKSHDFRPGYEEKIRKGVN